MNKKLIAIVICLTLVTSFTVGFKIDNVKATGTILYVGGSGPGNYTKIQDAIDNASSGDTVFVYNGIYYENVVICKTINLIGEDINNTIIDGGGWSWDVNAVNVSADFINLSGFTIQKFCMGICLDFSNNSYINDINILNNGWGIVLFNSNNNNIADNNVLNNYHGIAIVNFSNDNTITGNKANLNLYYGICLDLYCNNNTIEDNNSLNNENNGISLWHYSDNNTISGNNILNNGNGILLYYSCNNLITDNNVSKNGWGITIVESSSNMIYHNNFIGNNRNAYDQCNNTWDNGYPSGGNY